MSAVDRSWVVLKFGGTSLAGVSQWRQVQTLVRERLDANQRVLVVCSALAGVTDQLRALTACAAPSKQQIEQVLAPHRALAEALEIPVTEWLDSGRAQLEQALDMPPGPAQSAAVQACGEWFSSQLGAAYFRQLGQPCAWVDATEALVAEPEPDATAPRGWLSANCKAVFDPALEAAWGRKGPLLVAQGYVVRSPHGGPALLGRSGSDTSAALLGACLGAGEVEIWTDVAGVYTADPRMEPGARLVPEIGWEEALELAASGAEVIHGRSIRAAAAAGLTLRIRQLADPAAGGTCITARPSADVARAVVAKPDMLVLLLRNLDTRQQVGFLAGVFATISAQGISVDQVATSETTTSLAIDTATNHLDAGAIRRLTTALGALCQVEVFTDCVCVSVVGREVRLSLAALAATHPVLLRAPLHMMSHSAADRSVSLLVPQAVAGELVHCLHEELVLSEAEQEGRDLRSGPGEGGTG